MNPQRKDLFDAWGAYPHEVASFMGLRQSLKRFFAMTVPTKSQQPRLCERSEANSKTCG